ncbi:TetR/AcrR family transcriptional regulator [Micromonospora sp. SH-82]|uniref:TetR/AcrR family transcriptional regulator n=1 Tax=Micromonospora sp. SH-82 TaxID=3132938 RepID=UPI003EBF2D26
MTTRSTPYHHGDLRTALVEAGLRLARSGGLGALGLRELTRSIGVSPNAAYRHFADLQALVAAVAVEAQQHMVGSMLDGAAENAEHEDEATLALRRLRAVGLGYIRFALTEPGWFEVAVLTQDEPPDDSRDLLTDSQVPAPYQLLMDALDGLESAGVISTERRVGAEWACWSAVHGFAELAVRGPLRHQDRGTVDRLAAHVVDSIIRGVTNRDPGQHT